MSYFLSWWWDCTRKGDLRVWLPNISVILSLTSMGLAIASLVGS